MKKDIIKVIELFAGVGGFRVGLERCKNKAFDTIWSNQWEPSTNIQHASHIYQSRFKKGEHVNEDITKVPTSDIPNHDMLVGGFPCQDYSVTRILSQSKGLQGKKGVLWWEINRILEEKGAQRPKYLLLENVDRLLISPSTQRGRDFAIMLACLNKLGYAIEWRIINAAEYGMPQRRRRIYIVGYHKSTSLYKKIKNLGDTLSESGILAQAFPVNFEKDPTEVIPQNLFKEGSDILEISENFNKANKERFFLNSGIMINGQFISLKSTPDYHGNYTLLQDIIIKPEEKIEIPEEFYINDNDTLAKWEYLKGAKHEQRKRKDGGLFTYNEGPLAFPDPIDKPSRTIITSEGGRSASRTTHVIRDPYSNKLRRLLPIELERLNMFPDNHTKELTNTKRAFVMGNALVCGIVTNIGNTLIDNIKE